MLVDVNFTVIALPGFLYIERALVDGFDCLLLKTQYGMFVVDHL